MRNKFIDYLSSQITPQMTLLQKMNKIIEYLKSNPTVNIYQSTSNYSQETETYDLTSLMPTGKTIYAGDFVLFNNAFVGVIEAVGLTTITVLTATQLPKGATGKEGRGVVAFASGTTTVEGNKTITPVIVSYTDGSTPSSFNVEAQNGGKGTDGRGVVAFASGTPKVEGNKTITPVTALYTDGASPSSFNVEAQNGQNGENGISVISISAGTPVIQDNKTITPITFGLSQGNPVTVNAEAQNGVDGSNIPMYLHTVTLSKTDTDITINQGTINILLYTKDKIKYNNSEPTGTDTASIGKVLSSLYGFFGTVPSINGYVKINGEYFSVLATSFTQLGTTYALDVTYKGADSALHSIRIDLTNMSTNGWNVIDNYQPK